MLHFPYPKLPIPQKTYSKEERAQFDRLIEQIQAEPEVSVSHALISKALNKKQESRFYQYCDDNHKIRQFRQTCRDCHQALSEHAAYLQENLQANRQPEGPATPQILAGVLECRDNLLGMYARYIVTDIAASLEHSDNSQKKTTRPKSYPG